MSGAVLVLVFSQLVAGSTRNPSGASASGYTHMLAQVDHSQTYFVSVPQFAILVCHYNRLFRSVGGHARARLPEG